MWWIGVLFRLGVRSGGGSAGASLQQSSVAGCRSWLRRPAKITRSSTELKLLIEMCPSSINILINTAPPTKNPSS